ncbi:MAG: hypothetical protein CMN95_07190 [Synechococcus sp. MED650]|nr:hypothetical protein [Synechococcus sp. MED650]MEC8688887.1 DUF3727 domain-containing protein [Cyanobacteriota bacterium]OUW53981.1 MAG: hypothetical protein CBD48_05825 [Cyanobacteria bacterium TMED188]
MPESGAGKSGDHPTLLVRDREGHDLLCFLEHLIPVEGQDYALLSPVDTPVSLFRLSDEAEPEPITEVASSEPILSVADVVLQEHDLVLVRSAITLTVSGELEEPDQEDLEELEEEDDVDEDAETFELLVSFMVEAQEYGLYIPLDPFLVLVRMIDGQAELLNDEELDRIQPLIEAELEEREWPD